MVQWCYAGGHPAMVFEVERWFRACHLSRGIYGDIRDVVVVDAAGGLSWYDLSREIAAPAVGDVYRLVIIRRADEVPEETWAALTRWATGSGVVTRGVYVLALGDEVWNEKDLNDPRYPLFVGNTRGAYVTCKELSLEQQVKYVGHRFGFDPKENNPAVELLIRRCAGDLARLFGECAKLEYLLGEEPLSQIAVHRYIVPSPSDQFVDALITGRKAEALERAPYVRSVRFVVGALDWHLYCLVHMHRARSVLGRRKFYRDLRLVIQVTGLPQYTVVLLHKKLRDYTITNLRGRYAALIRAQRFADRAPPEIVLAPLVAQW